MEADQAQELSERDQLWASLRALRPQIERLALGDFDSSSQQQAVISLLARIVVAEIGFRERHTALDSV